MMHLFIPYDMNVPSFNEFTIFTFLCRVNVDVLHLLCSGVYDQPSKSLQQAFPLGPSESKSPGIESVKVRRLEKLCVCAPRGICRVSLCQLVDILKP